MPLPFSFHWLCASLLFSSRCKELKYSKELPQISIIFIFVNEALSVILRSVHSAVNHTPTHLLKEIILVDDNSDEGMGAASLQAVFWDNASRQCTVSAGGCALISFHPEPKSLCLLSLGHSWGMGAVWGEVIQANTSSLLESSRAGVSQSSPPPRQSAQQKVSPKPALEQSFICIYSHSPSLTLLHEFHLLSDRRQR